MSEVQIISSSSLKTEDPEIQKMYWTQSELSEMLVESYGTIRHWSDRFNIRTHVFKYGRARHPMYAKKEVALFHHIKRLLRKEKYTIEGAKIKLREAKLI